MSFMAYTNIFIIDGIYLDIEPTHLSPHLENGDYIHDNFLIGKPLMLLPNCWI